MQKTKHIRLAGILMILSWVLLFVFVAQWLITHYRAEKETLRGELDRQFASARSQVMDSTLVINLIDPMMKDQQHISVFRSRSDTVIRCPNKILNCDSILRLPGTADKNNVVYRINITDTGTKDNGKQNRMGAFCNDSDIVLHSIRLIISQAIDSGGNYPVFKQLLPAEIDTLMLRKIFTDKMNRQGLDFTINWHPGMKPDFSSRCGSYILLSGKVFNGSVNATVERFSWYLIKQIIPQILFAIVLLMLTGGAFIFTYRSLKKQMLLNTLRNDFIGNITHELKTPVATVKVALESLRNFDMKKDPAVASDYLNMASLEMNRLDQLINKVLNISLLEEHNRILTLRGSNLKSITERVIQSMTPRFEQEQTELLLEAPDDEYICPLDELFAEGVLINLIDNSLKYSPGKAKIRINLSQDQEQVSLTARDWGPGIPEEYIHKVFDKFFRIPTGDRHNVKGHGLGLSYAAQVMKQHHGTISLKNLEDGGCAFTLTFPKE